MFVCQTHKLILNRLSPPLEGVSGAIILNIYTQTHAENTITNAPGITVDQVYDVCFAARTNGSQSVSRNVEMFKEWNKWKRAVGGKNVGNQFKPNRAQLGVAYALVDVQ